MGLSEQIVVKAKRALRIVLKRKLDIKVVPATAKRNRLSAHYAADKARARERAERYAAAADMDAALTVVIHPCRCDPNGAARLLPCCC